MNDIHEYYNNMADVSVSTKEAIKCLHVVRDNVQEALRTINTCEKHGNTTISSVSNVTTNDVRRNLLFFELLLNQTFGVVNTLTFQELLELTNYSINGEES